MISVRLLHSHNARTSAGHIMYVSPLYTTYLIMEFSPAKVTSYLFFRAISNYTIFRADEIESWIGNCELNSFLEKLLFDHNLYKTPRSSNLFECTESVQRTSHVRSGSSPIFCD